MLDILYQDDHILILNKPANLSVLAEGWEPNAPYLLQMLKKEFGDIRVVHRLDKTTSGVMVFGRTAEVHRELNQQFERREVEKIYHAIVEGLPSWDEKVCRIPLRVNVGKKHRTAADHIRGKPSETRFKVLKRGKKRTLLEARPMTGRTHQIRAHLYALGYPLLGDVLYGAATSDLISRPALHALKLTFTHPESGELMDFTAEYPVDLSSLSALIGV
jgi:RluA family pseudouridine synthase